MTTGYRTVTDARKRAMMHPQVQAYWNELDCGFPPVADVFEECMAEALSVLSQRADRRPTWRPRAFSASWGAAPSRC